MQQNIQQQTTVSVQNGLIDMCKKLLGLKEVSVYEWNNHDNEYFVVHDDVNHKDILLVAKNSGAMLFLIRAVKYMKNKTWRKNKQNNKNWTKNAEKRPF